MRTGRFPWNSNSASISVDSQADPLRHLVVETSAILNWSHHLRPLLRSGWTTLGRTKLSANSIPVRSTRTVSVAAPLLPPPASSVVVTPSKPDHALGSVLHHDGSLLPSDGPKTLIGVAKLNDFAGNDQSASSEDQVNPPGSLKVATIASTPLLHPADVDWISVNTTPGTSSVPSISSLPFVLSRTDSVTKDMPPLGDPSTTSMYDELGQSAGSLGIYQQQSHHLSDTVLADEFTERVSTAIRDLECLDERILTPLELTLSEMESRLDKLNTEVTFLEQQKAHASVTRLQPGLARGLHDRPDPVEPEDEYCDDITEDSNGLTTDHQLDTDTMIMSPLCSSSSSTFSLSPHQNPVEESKAMVRDFSQQSYKTSFLGLSHSTGNYSVDDLVCTRAKRAARKLYRFAVGLRPSRARQPSNQLGNMALTARTKPPAPHLFPSRNPVPSSRM
ncbi:unnamed protein product [Echinostoma caproni]|uniref:Uncharacterized protein n=1 Tax=Echinostoma caproni TaxID=27848 RepID=A0A183AVA6_9TREM|nr:unnamed protein product [Echinostoma caproni]